LFQDAPILWNPIAFWGKCTLHSPKKVMKVHFYSPNPMIFQKTHLNDVEVHIFFHFQVHATIIYLFFKTSENMGLEKINLDTEMDFMNFKFSF